MVAWTSEGQLQEEEQAAAPLVFKGGSQSSATEPLRGIGLDASG